MPEMSEIYRAQLERCLACVRAAGEEGATIKQITECMDFKQPSPYLIGLLDWLNQQGLVARQPSQIKTGRGLRLGWRYYAPK